MQIAPTYAFATNLGMGRAVNDWFREHLERMPHGAAGQLARRLSISRSAITEIKKGNRNIKAQELRVIERFFGDKFDGDTSGIDYLVENDAPPIESRRIPIVGYVGAGGQTYSYNVAQGHLDEVDATVGSTEKTVAVEIRGESLGLMFDRWLVFYDDIRSPVTQDLIGKLCVVGLEDDSVLVKKIARGSRMGFFNLISEREPPIENVTIRWAAKVKMLAPR